MKPSIKGTIIIGTISSDTNNRPMINLSKTFIELCDINKEYILSIQDKVIDECNLHGNIVVSSEPNIHLLVLGKFTISARGYPSLKLPYKLKDKFNKTDKYLVEIRGILNSKRSRTKQMIFVPDSM